MINTQSRLIDSQQLKTEKSSKVSQQKQDLELTGCELLLAKFRLKLKKVEKTIKPFRYDRNQIPYDYTVDVTNRFKGLYLVNRVPKELWMEVHNTVQEAVTKTIPKKNKYKKAKWLSEKALQIAEEKKGKARERERYT